MNNDQYFDDFFDNEEVTNTNEGMIQKSDISILKNYSEELTAKTYITNPAIARDEEIKKMILILLSPEKSVVLTGKAGIGKTAIVEGLSYKIQNKDVPNALINSKIYRINTSALLGKYEHDGVEESKLQMLIDEIKGKKDIILFIDEVHTLVTAARNGGGVDFLNMLKPGLDRGDIKIIGATVKILMRTIKKIEASTGVTFPYSDWVLEELCKFIVNMTSEYKRIYENGSRYPDVSLALFSKIFTFAKFENSDKVTFKHIYEAIKNTNLVYDDVIKKELPVFESKFSEFLKRENVTIEK